MYKFFGIKFTQLVCRPLQLIRRESNVDVFSLFCCLVLYFVEGSFLAGKAAWALRECLTTKSADYCVLVNVWVWLRSLVCLPRLEVDLGSVLESELRQKFKYGALEAFIH